SRRRCRNGDSRWRRRGRPTKRCSRTRPSAFPCAACSPRGRRCRDRVPHAALADRGGSRRDPALHSSAAPPHRNASGVASRAAVTDRLWLITADGTVHGGTRDAVVQAIEHTGPLAGAGNIEDAAVRAASLVGGSGLAEREVAIVTDGQATSWSAPITLGQSRVQVYRPRQDPPRNAAVI